MKRITSLALTLAVIIVSPLSIVAQTPEEQYEAHITAFAQTHTNEEVSAETQRWMNNALLVALMEQSLQGPTPVGRDFGTLVGDPIGFADCMSTNAEICRNDYNSEIIAATGTSFMFFGGCAAATALYGTIVCGIAGVAGQQAAFQAAIRRQFSCEARGRQICVRDFGDCPGPSACRGDR